MRRELHFMTEEQTNNFYNYVDKMIAETIEHYNLSIYFNNRNSVDDVYDMVKGKFDLYIAPTIEDMVVTIKKDSRGEEYVSHVEEGEKSIMYNTISSYENIVNQYIRECIEEKMLQ